MILTVFFSKEKNRRIQQQFRSVQSSKQVHHDTVIFIVLSSLTGYTSTIASAARVTKAGRAGHFIEKQTIFKSVFFVFYALQGPSSSKAARIPSRETSHLPECEPSQEKVGPNIFPSPNVKKKHQVRYQRKRQGEAGKRISAKHQKSDKVVISC